MGVTSAAIRLLVLDADVGEVDLVIEVRQVVFVRPFANLIRRSIRLAVVVVMVVVAFVEPPLVLALQLVVQDDALDARTAVKETVLGTNGRERPRLGAAQGVLAIAVVNELTLRPARQVNMSAECIRNLAIAFSIVAVAVGPAGIVDL